MMQEKKVTIDDVAAAAGVSRQTVSRAINNLDGISDTTRQQVLSVAKKLGYQPSRLARSLASASQQTRTLGIMLPSVDNEFYATVLRGIETKASQQGYQLLLCSTDEDPETEYAKIQSLFSAWIDGLILLSSRMSDDQLSDICERTRPVVLINREFHHPNAGNVVVDDFSGTYAAVNHLINRGHHTIAFLLGLPYARSSQLRQQGFQAALKESGLPVEPSWQIHTDAHIESGYHSALQLLSDQPNITALVVYNDVRAAGVLRACKELGISIPDQLSIISHDNIALSSLLIPSLTTVDIPKQALGEAAIDMMLSMMENSTISPNTLVFKPKLIIRESCP
jgi:LacI family transcriptional regulator